MSNFDDVLKRLGWDDGFQIPVANAENAELEKELAKLTLRSLKAKNALDNTTARLAALNDHLKYVNQENDQTQKLITAHKQQFDSEQHQLLMTNAEKSRTEKDIKETVKRIEGVKKREASAKDDLQNAVKKAEKLKAETTWDIEALKTWEDLRLKKDAQMDAVTQIAKKDTQKYIELETKKQLLHIEHLNKSQQVKNIVGELNRYEMLIERTGKAIKQQRNEREALIGQWKSTVKMLQQRDKDISDTQDAIMENQALIEKQKEALDDANTFLQNQIRNNRETELVMQELNAVNSRLRREYGDLTQHTLLLASELQAVKRTVASSSQRLEDTRIKCKRTEEMINEKEELCVKYQEDIDRLKRKIEEMRENSIYGADRLKRLEKMIDNETRQHDIYVSETEKINGNIFTTEKILRELKDAGRNMEIDLHHVNCIANKLRKLILEDKKDLTKKKEAIYEMDYRIDELEQKLCRVSESKHNGNMSEELDDKIRQLEKNLSDNLEMQHTLNLQVHRLQDEMRRIANVIAIDKEKQIVLHNKVENYLLEYEIGRKQIAAAKKSAQEKQVEENMMSLRIAHIESNMKKEDRKIYDQEKMRLNLDQAMKERQMEIDTKKSVIQVKRRNLDEDRGRLKADICIRKRKIEQLQKKYHIELMCLGQDEDGQPLSVTHIKIKNAQEKFLLQQEGDDLDNKIKQAEQEIVAMENTLKVVNLTNSAFKNSLSPMKEDDEEIQEFKQLQVEHRENVLELKELSKVVQKKQNELIELQNLWEENQRKLDEFKEVLNNLDSEIVSIRNQEMEKTEKLQRAESQLKKHAKKLGNRDVSKFVRDLEVRHLKETNRAIMNKMIDIQVEYVDVAPLLTRYLLEYELELPQKKVSQSCSSSSTSRSSLFSTNSSVNVSKVDLSWPA